MKRIVTILLSVCFLAMPLLLSGGSLRAMVEDSPQLDALRQQNEQLKQMVEELKKELDQMKLQTEDQMHKAVSQAKAKDEELSAMEQLKELMTGQMQDQLKAKEQYLQAFEQLQMMQEDQIRPQVEKGLDAARRAVETAQKALENVEVPEKMEEFLQQFLTETPQARNAGKVSDLLAEIQKAKAKKAVSQQRLAQALEQYENALRQTTPQQLSKVLRDRMLSQLAKQGSISEKAKSLEDSILSRDDMGLLTQLRFEKVDLCRELGKLDEAADELGQIIEESLDARVRTSARWMLIELLQEAGKRDEALKELMNMIQATTDPKEKRSILYAIIQMAGDDPEDRLKATEEVIDWLEENVRDAQEEARDKAKRVQCASNLKQLVLAMLMWSASNNGAFPEKLSVLYPNYVNSLDMFVCPSEGGPVINKERIDSQTTYILRKPPTDTPPSQEVVLYERPSQHGGEGGNAAFADGHVEWLDAERLRKIAEIDRKASPEPEADPML